MAADKIFARDIITYSDEQLDRYLEENRRLVSVHDPENLPESFIQRLRDRVRSTNRSRPVDLDQVSARLLQTSPESRTSPKKHTPIERRARRHGLSLEAFMWLRVFEENSSQDPSTPGSSQDKTPDPDERYQELLGWEKKYYEELVNDGGRPWYPIHRLEEVSRHPREHGELLRAWQLYPDERPDDWCVFGPQVLRWRHFRTWQGSRRTQHKGRISDYTQSAKRFLLNRHSYTAPVEFDFEEDPKQQDQLTTFIEYLAYEYNFYTDRYAWHERRGNWYDQQWGKLVDSGLLRPYETAEFLLNGDSSFQRTGERLQAEKAVEAAQSAVSLAQGTIRGSSQPTLPMQQTLEAAQSKLQSAVQLLESIQKHNQAITKFIVDTYPYRDAKASAERHSLLLQWIRDQVSLMSLELEPGQFKIADNSSDGRKRTKRGLECEQDEIVEEGSSNRQKRNAPNECSHNNIMDNEPLSTGHENSRQAYHSHIQTPDKAETAVIGPPRAATHPLRRSARIATRQEAAQRAVVTRSSAAQNTPRRSRRRRTQAPASLSSTRPQDQQPRFPATKVMIQKKFRRQSVSQRGGVQTHLQDILKIQQPVQLTEAGPNAVSRTTLSPRSKPTGKIQKPTSRPSRRVLKTTAQGSRASQQRTRRSGQEGQSFHELDSHGKARLVVVA